MLIEFGLALAIIALFAGVWFGPLLIIRRLAPDLDARISILLYIALLAVAVFVVDFVVHGDLFSPHTPGS
jgi:hypothetical protein